MIDSIAVHSEVARLAMAVFLLGLGWSACIIGGSTLLTQSVTSDTRVPLQGAVDSLMNFGAAAMAAVAGPMLMFGGFLAVNIVVAFLLAPVLFFGLRAIASRRPEPTSGPSGSLTEPMLDRRSG